MEQTIYGSLGCIFSIISYMLQVKHTFKTKKMGDNSYFFLLFSMVCSVTWILYGIYSNDIIIIVTDLILFTMQFLLYILKYNYTEITVILDNNDDNNDDNNGDI